MYIKLQQGIIHIYIYIYILCYIFRGALNMPDIPVDILNMTVFFEQEAFI